MTLEHLERRRRFITRADGCVSLLDVGSGPATLFVHGIATNALLWRHVIAEVSESRRCIAVDLPLHGQSPLAEGQPSRPGRRRWCAGEACGNRTRTQAYRQRHRKRG